MGKGEKEEFKDKMDKRLGVLITYTDKGTGLVSMPVGSFPLKLWQEWEQDCKENFNGIRWMKIWNDHLKAKNNNLEFEVELYKVEMEKQKEKVEEEAEGNPLGLLNPGKGE